LSRKAIIRLLVALTFVFALLQEVVAQGHRPLSKRNLMAEFKGQYGFLMSHHLELDIFQAHYPAFEFSIEKATWGKHHWETIYGYPIIGLSVWYSPLGGSEEIGSAIAVYPFINFPIVQDQDQSLNFRLGCGLSFLTNYFDRLENYKNFAIGSYINVAGSIFLEYRRKLTKMITLTGGIGLTHFSNGSVKTPNYGLNTLTASIGFASYLARPNPQMNKKMLPELYQFEFDGKKTLDFDVVLSLGVKDMSQQYGQSFMVYALYANLLKQVSWKSKFGVGFDLTYDASDKFILDWSGEEYSNELQILKPGLNLGYQLLIGKMSFVFNMGWYLSGAEMSEGNVYQRLTLRYLFSDNLFANIALNTNWGKAEYIGFGIGYQFSFIYGRKVKH
jgi:hypothetical protein